MGNSFPGLFCRFTAPRPGRRKAAHAVAASLEETEFDIGETNQPMAVFGFGHANGFADQRLADEDQLASPFDFAIAAHPSLDMVGIVTRFARSPGRPVGSLIVLGGSLLAQRLVRTLVIVTLAEGVEAPLLLARRRGGRMRGLRLQGAVHALVPAVLLWCARLDPLELDPELQPLDRKAREPARAGRGERRSVVGADRLWQPVAVEQPLEAVAHLVPAGRHDAAIEQEPAVGIADRQRIAARA